jgi:hypothetical protein
MVDGVHDAPPPELPAGALLDEFEDELPQLAAPSEKATIATARSDFFISEPRG